MENRGFPLRGMSLALSLRVHERNKLALLLFLLKVTSECSFDEAFYDRGSP